MNSFRNITFGFVALILAGSTWAASGDLDSTFASGGISATLYASGTDIAVQSDGKLVTAESVLTRRNSNGSLDTTFGSGGTVNVAARLVAVQADGRIIVDTYQLAIPAQSSSLLRYLSNGTIDTSFGTSGATNLPVSATDMLIQADGKILLVGGGNLIRLNNNGSLDAGFGAGGIITTDGSSLALQADGKILVAGTAPIVQYSATGVTRYLANGSLDSTFGSNGTVATSLPSVVGVAVQADGKVVVVGSTGNLAVARYNSNGSVDSAFGSSGMTVTSFGVAGSGFNQVAIQPDGKIVAMGNGGTRLAQSGYGRNFYDNNMVLVRYDSNGMIDGRFAHQGIAEFDYDHWDDYAQSMALQADGKILVIGYSGTGTTKSGPYSWATTSSSIILRYLP